MIHFERTKDYELVRTIATHPAIYNAISDDGSPARDDFRPIENEQVWYVLAYDEDELLGMWTLIPENAICWDVHTCLLPSAWGERAARAGKDFIHWVFENTPCRRLITHVPSYNRLALRFALKAGMEPWGRNPKSYLKDGAVYDQIMLGMSKPCH